MLKIIRESNMPSKKRAQSGKHHTSNNSSETALKRKIQARVAPGNKKNTLFGLYNVKSTDGSTVSQRAPNRGDQSTYLYFKHIFPMPLKTVTKQ
jgi:hypothetical protein